MRVTERLWRWLYLRAAKRSPSVLYETYEVTQPWLVYTYFLTDDSLLIRVGGVTSIRCECCICGEIAFPAFRIPRRGPLADRGHHPFRLRFMRRHEHRFLAGSPLHWERPLRNIAALRAGDFEEIAEIAVQRARRDARGGNR